MTDVFSLNNSYLSLPGHMWSKVDPSPLESLQWVLYNSELARDIGIAEKPSQELLEILGGNEKVKDGAYIAQAYAGHQFGHFTILGDGRALLIGEHLTPDNKRIDIQLKGSGPTKYSRRGDGRATLYSMLREYIISEAIHYLGIPTTRSLAVVESSTPIYRETPQKSGVLTRLASSHIRVGTYEYVRQYGKKEDLVQLIDYVIDRHYPSLSGRPDRIVGLLKMVMLRQIDLIVAWTRVGFIHGVMNTDNMSIAGETIDYGPCAFMNTYDPATVFSSIDHQGRYAFGNQPSIGHWNLSIFASTLMVAMSGDKDDIINRLQSILDEYPALFKQKYYQMMLEKIGLKDDTKANRELIDEFLEKMYKLKLDYNFSFYRLTYETDKLAPLLKEWLTEWRSRFKSEKTFAEAQQRMKKVNPVIVARNHWIEEVLSEAIIGNMEPMHHALQALKSPYSLDNRAMEKQRVPELYDQTYQTFCGT